MQFQGVANNRERTGLQGPKFNQVA